MLVIHCSAPGAAMWHSGNDSFIYWARNKGPGLAPPRSGLFSFGLGFVLRLISSARPGPVSLLISPLSEASPLLARLPGLRVGEVLP
jgi:hypothetical protein